MKLVQQKYFLFANSWSLRTTSVLFFGQRRSIKCEIGENSLVLVNCETGWYCWSWKFKFLFLLTQYELVCWCLADVDLTVVVDADIDVHYDVSMIMLNLILIFVILLVKIPTWKKGIFLVFFVWIFSLNTCDVGTDYVYYDERYKRLWYWHSKWIITFKADIIYASCDI